MQKLHVLEHVLTAAGERNDVVNLRILAERLEATRTATALLGVKDRPA